MDLVKFSSGFYVDDVHGTCSEVRSLLSEKMHRGSQVFK